MTPERASQRLLAKLGAHHPEYMPPELMAMLRPDGQPAPVPKLPPAMIRDQDTRPRVVPKHQPSIADIAEVVAWFYRMSMADLKSDLRWHERVRPRQVVWYLTRKMIVTSIGAPVTYHRIARFFRKDHTTVLSGVLCIERGINGDERLRDEIEVIRLHVMDKIGQPCGASLPQPRAYEGSRLDTYYKVNGA